MWDELTASLQAHWEESLRERRHRAALTIPLLDSLLGRSAPRRPGSPAVPYRALSEEAAPACPLAAQALGPRARDRPSPDPLGPARLQRRAGVGSSLGRAAST
jgi:hypothetical protein